MNMFHLLSQFFYYGSFYILNLLGRLEACHNLPFLVDKELSEVPLDVRRLAPVGVCLVEHLHQDGCNLICHVETSKPFLALEELVERVGIVAIHLKFLELWELGAVVELAELVYALVGARSLVAKLIAGEVEDLESLGVILLI